MTEAQARTAASAIVSNYAPDAPADVQTAAVELLIDSLRDLPYENDTHFADQQVSTHNLGANLIQRCGASSILAPWRRPRARVIEAAAS